MKKVSQKELKRLVKEEKAAAKRLGWKHWGTPAQLAEALRDVGYDVTVEEIARAGR